MEQETYERADLLAAIVEFSFDAIISKTLQGTVTSWNPAAARLFGYRPDEMIGDSIRRLIPARQQDEEDRILERIEAGERVEPYGTVRLHKNGDPIDVFLTISPIRGPAGKVIGASKIIRDVTLQKAAAETARASEERLRQFVEQAPAAIAMFDREMRYVACSRRWLTDRGRQEESVIGRSHYEVFPEVPERWKEAHRRGMAGEVICEEKDAFLRADGRTLWMRWELRPWLTSGGAVGGITIIAEDVSEKIEAARDLLESELRMRLAQEAAKVGAWEWWLADDRNEWSGNLWGLYGLEPGQCPCSFQAWASSIHPEDRERVIRLVREEAATGREYETQWRVNLPEGEPERWLSARGSPIAGASGSPERYIGVVFDITERRRAEEAARQAEALERSKREELEAILAAIPAPVLIAKDASCKDMIGNPAAYELYRLPSGANISKSAPVGKAPANFEIFQNGRRLPPEQFPIRKAAARQTFSREEIELRFIEGDSKYLLGNALPLFNEAGEVRGAVAAFADVTGLKRTEAALRESEARLTAIINSAADSIIVIDEKGIIQSANPATLDVFGYSPEDLAGRNVGILMPPDVAERHDRCLQAFSRKGDVRQVEGRRKDGAAIPVDIAIADWQDGEGRRFFTGILRDLTERKRHEAAMADARRREAVGQLAGGVAHDFNNLLHAISGYLEIAQRRIGDGEAKGFLERARMAAQKGSALNQRLLSFARKRALKPERLNLNDRVQDTVKLLASTVGEHVSLKTDLAAGLWVTMADPGEIDSAILNVAANARDAMPRGGGIWISTSNVMLDRSAAAKLHPDARAADYVCLSIADNGPGMSPEVLAQAFEPFFTTKGPGIGTGLGLPSVADFAKQAGGFASIESALGQGCTVRVYLPRANEKARAAAPSLDGLPLGGGELVLVVEDDSQVREMTLLRLQSIGYAAAEAKTGPEAIEQLKMKLPIRLVLSDIVMPGGMTGHDVERWVAANKPDVKVILCSGYNEGDIVRDAEGRIDGVAVLGKPYTREALAKALCNALAP